MFLVEQQTLAHKSNITKRLSDSARRRLDDLTPHKAEVPGHAGLFDGQLGLSIVARRSMPRSRILGAVPGTSRRVCVRVVLAPAQCTRN